MKTKPEKGNTTGLPLVKRFLYSHIARLFYLISSRRESVMRALISLNIHFLPWKMLHALLMWELELHIPFV
jgi:hypothetical protein